MLVDILFSVGTLAFVASNFRQLHKIIRTKKTDGLSGTKYKIKFFASSCMITGSTIGVLPITLLTSSVDMSITIVIIILLARYRRISVWRL